jgi:hypothetical protein
MFFCGRHYFYRYGKVEKDQLMHIKKLTESKKSYLQGKFSETRFIVLAFPHLSISEK